MALLRVLRLVPICSGLAIGAEVVLLVFPPWGWGVSELGRNLPKPSELTYWNGEPCEARRVRVIVGPPPVPTWWCAEYEGQEREAVEVHYGPMRYLLDNEDGSGWRKVTEGRGSPRLSHGSLPESSVFIGFVDNPSGCEAEKGKAGK